MCKVTHIWTGLANQRRDTLRIEYGPSLSDLTIRVGFRCIVLDPKRELGDETQAAMIFASQFGSQPGMDFMFFSPKPMFYHFHP